MLTTIKSILLVLALAGLTFAALDAHADCPTHDVAKAEAAVLVAQARRFHAFDPAPCRTADELVRAAVEQLRAAKALCDEPVAVAIAADRSDPFEVQP